MSKETSSNNDSAGFGGLLTLLFIGLKLTGHIDWSWWWVLAPVWLPALIVIIIVTGILLTGALLDVAKRHL